MVRINLIEPKVLSDQHLIAEHNEIQMLMTTLLKYGHKETTQHEFTLGRGHMRFFYNKPHYIWNRLQKLNLECKNRGFNCSIRRENFLNECININNIDYKPTNNDILIIKHRIRERLFQKPSWYRYNCENKNLEFWEEMLK